MDSSPDCPIFAQIYRQLGGTNTSLTNTNCCTLFPNNVVCAKPGNTTNIYQISFNAKSFPIKGGSISPLFAKLPTLQTLQLTDIGLTGPIPPLPQMLSGLLLAGNQLSGPIPDLNFFINNAQLGNPFLNLKNNNFGGVTIPPKLAGINWNANVGCPFATNMCSNVTVQSCPGVIFTCQADQLATSTPSANSTSAPKQTTSADTIFGLDKPVAYGVGGGAIALLILIVVSAMLFVGKKKPTAQAPPAESIKNGNIFAQQYSPPQQSYQGPAGYVLPNGQQYVVLTPVPSPQQPNNICLNCGFNPKTHAVIPCGHEIFCTACAELNADGGVCNLCNQRFLIAQPIHSDAQQPRVEQTVIETSPPRFEQSPAQTSDHPRYAATEVSEHPRYNTPQADDSQPRYRY
ncbi:hypothetical protein HDV01_006496 [Terramyces sp. JEL0728]|nr:hypothetical protein HDV01_006496 [Terramyces sp. JEL0728]